jgi:hypothetical protein
MVRSLKLFLSIAALVAGCASSASAAEKYQLIPVGHVVDNAHNTLTATALRIDTEGGKPARCVVEFNHVAFQWGNASCVPSAVTGTMPAGPGFVLARTQPQDEHDVLWKVDQSSGDVTLCVSAQVSTAAAPAHPWWCSGPVK